MIWLKRIDACRTMPMQPASPAGIRMPRGRRRIVDRCRSCSLLVDTSPAKVLTLGSRTQDEPCSAPLAKVGPRLWCPGATRPASDAPRRPPPWSSVRFADTAGSGALEASGAESAAAEHDHPSEDAHSKRLSNV